MGAEDLRQKYKAIASNEGTKLFGIEYVPFHLQEPPLNEKILNSIKDSIFPYDFDPPCSKASEMSLNDDWKATSFGGDTCKLIAVNKDLGVAVKRYMNSGLAWMVFHAYSTLAEAVDPEHNHLLMPIARYGDTLIFPYLEIDDNPKDVDNDEVRKITAQASNLPPYKHQFLSIATKFKKLELKDHTNYFYSDLFDDSKTAIEWDIEKLEQFKDFG